MLPAGRTIVEGVAVLDHGLDRRRWTLAMLAGALWPHAARADRIPAPTAPNPSTPEPDAPGADLRTYTDLYERMTAPVRVNGQGPFAFVVDTGANRSVISTELAAQLSLIQGPDEPVNGAAGIRIAPTVTVNMGVGARSESEQVLSVLPAGAIGGLGMLGVDRLEGQRVTLDFRAKALRIETSGHGVHSPNDIVIPAHRQNGQLTLIDAELSGAALTAFVDSGAQSTIGNPALRALAHAREPGILWTTASILSATGQMISAEVAQIPNLRVGGLELKNVPVAFADLHTFHLWPLAERPALLIGVDVLSQFDYVALDFGRGEVRFHLPERV
jgi:predicted aspartyl protease